MPPYPMRRRTRLTLVACSLALACSSDPDTEPDVGDDTDRTGRSDVVVADTDDADAAEDTADDTPDVEDAAEDAPEVDAPEADADAADVDGDADADADTQLCRPGSTTCAEGRAAVATCDEDGQAWSAPRPCGDDEYCESGVCFDVSCLPSVMFAIDGSTSMSDQWPTIRSSIETVTSLNPDVAFGLSAFPAGLGCSVGDGPGGLSDRLWPDVAIQPNAGPALDAWLSENGAAGGATPLVKTLEWFAENAEAAWGGLENSAYLIVMSEGSDTCACDPDDVECLEEELGAATAALLEKGVRTYVIGYQYEDAEEALNAIAAAGGTEQTTFIEAGNEETLTDAFEFLIRSAKLCR